MAQRTLLSIDPNAVCRVAGRLRRSRSSGRAVAGGRKTQSGAVWLWHQGVRVVDDRNRDRGNRTTGACARADSKALEDILAKASVCSYNTEKGFFIKLLLLKSYFVKLLTQSAVLGSAIAV